MKLGLLHSTIRAEEKLLIKAAKAKNIEISLIDIREQVFDPATFKADFDVALERSVSTTKGNYAIHFLESLGIPVVNSSRVAAICEDKFLTSLALAKNEVPTPDFALVFDLKQARQAVKKMGGFPVVMKPTVGSCGRLVSKINDLDSLEAIIDHKQVLGGPGHKAFYLQQYIDKPGRDIRAFVIGGQTICAIYRTSKHWITNTAKGGESSNCPVTNELAEICDQASTAVGGGILAMDLFETDDGLTINEINHTMEFRNSEAPTGVSISEAMIDYCIKTAQDRKLK